MELKKNTIFNIFETTRQLFNNYCNGHGNNFTDEELKQAHYEETFKNELPF